MPEKNFQKIKLFFKNLLTILKFCDKIIYRKRDRKSRMKEDKMKHIIEFIILLLTGKSKEAVDSGICDFSGQGRNKYGI